MTQSLTQQIAEREMRQARLVRGRVMDMRDDLSSAQLVALAPVMAQLKSRETHAVCVAVQEEIERQIQ